MKCFHPDNLSIQSRNCCVHMPFQIVLSKMVERKNCRYAMKTALPLISSFATTIGCCLKKNVTAACRSRHEATSDCPIAMLFPDTMHPAKRQLAHGLALPK